MYVWYVFEYVGECVVVLGVDFVGGVYVDECWCFGYVLFVFGGIG